MNKDHNKLDSLKIVKIVIPSTQSSTKAKKKKQVMNWTQFLVLFKNSACNPLTDPHKL
jgi:hypothetical protein